MSRWCEQVFAGMTLQVSRTVWVSIDTSDTSVFCDVEPTCPDTSIHCAMEILRPELIGNHIEDGILVQASS